MLYNGSARTLSVIGVDVPEFIGGLKERVDESDLSELYLEF